MKYQITTRTLPHFRWQILADYVSTNLRKLGYSPKLSKVLDEESDAEVTINERPDVHVQVGDGYYVVHCWDKNHDFCSFVQGECDVKKEIERSIVLITK